MSETAPANTPTSHRMGIVFQGNMLAPPTPQPEIPKKIWTFWNSDDLPLLMRACVQTWRDHHPDYEVTVVTPSNAERYAGELPDIKVDNTPQRQSDRVRLRLLERHGGIWMDASIILRKRLDFIHEAHHTQQSDAVMYFLRGKTTDPYFPIIENWFIAAPPGSQFIKDLREEYEGTALRLGGKGYAEFLRGIGELDNIKQKLDKLDYFSQHLAIQLLLRRSNSYRIPLLRAETDAYRLHSLAKWELDEIHKRLLDISEPKIGQTFIKIRGKDWRPIRERVERREFHADSIVGKIVSRLG